MSSNTTVLCSVLFCLATQALCSYLLNDVGSCNFGELPCDNGQCIDRKAWCDGPVHCTDESDENFCRTINPFHTNGSKNPNGCDKSSHFICDNGLCIPKAARCDDMPDCENGEDEENCDYSYESSEDAESELPPTTNIPTTIETTTTSDSTTTAATTTTASSSASSRKPLTWIPSRFDVLHKSVQHVIEMRDVRWGWGRATPKVVTALSLANQSYFDLDNHDGLMTKKQLEVQLALDLMKHAEKPMRIHDLIHYVHALLATCNSPKDFHGVNIVRLLKRTIAQRQMKGLFVNPSAYLALCNAGDFSDSYLRKLKNMAYRRSEEQRWLDIQAYALMAISCRVLTNRKNTKEWLHLKKDVARNITEWQQTDGSFGNVYSTGLALQALIAAEEPGTEGSKGRAMTYLLMKQDWQGSFGHDMDNFYVLPALNIRSLAHVHERNCKPNPYGTQNTEAARHHGKKKQMIVHYSLWIGGDKNEIHTITLGLPKHSNFLEVMEAAEKMNPRYKHEILITARGTTVNSIAGKSSNVEKSTYWTLYRRVPLPFRPVLANTTATVARLKLFGAKRWIRDLKKLHPKDGEHLAFWYKPYL